MASKIVYQRAGSGKGSPAVVLVAGLEWRVLSGGTDADLRERGRERSATHVSLIRFKNTSATRSRRYFWQRHPASDSADGGNPKDLQVGDQALTGNLAASVQRRPVGGFFVNVEGTAPPAKSHSLAAAFAGWMAAHPNALLCYAVSAAERQRLHHPLPEGTWLVVVVVAGSPVVDAVVTNGDEAHALMASYRLSHPDISVVSNDTVRYPQTVKAENILPALVNYALTSRDASTQLHAIPADTRKWMVLAVLAALATGLYLHHQKNQQEAERQRVLLERRNNDPAQLYTAALRTQGHQMGHSRPSLLGAVDAVARLPLRVGGWQLKGASCESTCTAQYLRQFGTTSELHTALSALGSGYTLLPPLASDTDLDKATVAVHATLEAAGPEPQAPTSAEFLQGKAANQLQAWKTAGLSLQMQSPQLWPQVPKVPANFKAANAISVGKLEVGGIALPLLKEVLNTAPANVVWKGFRIEVATGNPSANPIDQAKAQVTGAFYLKN